MSRKLISFDWAIKKILRSKANFGILEGFLSELLFTDITILEVLESEGNQEFEENKTNRVDIKVIDSDQQIIIVEIQYSRELDYLQRILFATFKTINEHLQEGDAYVNVSKVISINILYFDFGKGDDYIYHGKTKFIGLHDHHELQLSDEQKRLYKVNTISDIYPEYYLIELRNFNDIAKNSLDEWIYFLKNEKINDNFHAKGLKQAKQTLDVLKMNEKEHFQYEQHQKQLHHEASLYQSTYVLGKMEGMEKGMEIGEERGIAKNNLSTAKRLKEAGVAIETIMLATDLSINQINEL